MSDPKEITVLVSDKDLEIIREYRRSLHAEEKPDDYIIGSAFNMAVMHTEDYLRQEHGPAKAGTPNLGTHGVPP